jgi:hypothetical protein
MSKTIQQECERFLELLVPAGAPEQQRADMEAAFYSGAWIIHKMMGEAVNQEDEEKAKEDIQKIYLELRDLARQYTNTGEDDV